MNYIVTYPPTTQMGSFEVMIRAEHPDDARRKANDAYRDAYKHDHPTASQPYWPRTQDVRIRAW